MVISKYTVMFNILLINIIFISTSPRDLPDQHWRIEPGSPALQADSLPPEPSGNPLLLLFVLLSTEVKWSEVA